MILLACMGVAPVKAQIDGAQLLGNLEEVYERDLKVELSYELDAYDRDVMLEKDGQLVTSGKNYKLTLGDDIKMQKGEAVYIVNSEEELVIMCANEVGNAITDFVSASKGQSLSTKETTINGLSGALISFESEAGFFRAWVFTETNYLWKITTISESDNTEQTLTFLSHGSAKSKDLKFEMDMDSFINVTDLREDCN